MPVVCSQVADEVSPVFEIASVMSVDCPKDMSQCGFHQWELMANLNDGNGTGIEKVLLQVGDGTLVHGPLSAAVVQLDYKASCCSLGLEIAAWDKAGNMRTFQYSVEPSASPPALTLSLPLWLCLLISAVAGRL